MWPYLRPHTSLLVGSYVITLLASAAVLAQPLVTRTVISSVENGSPNEAATAALALLVLAGACAAGASAWLLSITGEKVVRAVRMSLARHVLGMRVRDIERSAPGDTLARLTSDTQLLKTAVSGGTVKLLDGVVTAIASVGVMVYLDVRLTLIAVIALGAVALLASTLFASLRRSFEATQRAVGGMGQALMESLTKARLIKSYQAEQWAFDKSAVEIEGAYVAGKRSASLKSVLVSSTEIASQAAFVIIIGFGGAMVASGSLDVATLVAFLLALFHLTAPMSAVFAGLTDLQQGMTALDRIQETMSSSVEVAGHGPDAVEEHSGVGSSDPILPTPPRVDFDQVSADHPGRGGVVSRVTFSASPRSITAIVGPSGAGKSTLFSLLNRFDEPSSGSIKLDGRDIADVPVFELRRRIAWVDQDNSFVSGSLLENLTLGDRTISNDRVMAALDVVGLSSLVDKLPDGLNSSVAINGPSISGGERQRLAIARALLRWADVILLDESTSQLDDENQALICDLVRRLAQTSTVLLIAHRPSMLDIADQVVTIGDVSSSLDDAVLRERRDVPTSSLRRHIADFGATRAAAGTE
jgi:ATP-binding cassette subfamily B protein/ATP-binding cassette subfamily C protein